MLLDYKFKFAYYYYCTKVTFFSEISKLFYLFSEMRLKMEQECS